MKTTLTKTETNRRYANEVRGTRSTVAFPRTASNYHTSTFDLNDRCSSKRSRKISFRDISASYSEHEARQGFITEAAYFGLIIVLTGMSLVSSAHAWLHLLRAIGGL